MKHGTLLLIFMFGCLAGSATGLFLRNTRNEESSVSSPEALTISLPSFLRKFPVSSLVSIPVPPEKRKGLNIYFGYTDENNHTSVSLFRSRCLVQRVTDGTPGEGSTCEYPADRGGLDLEIRHGVTLLYIGGAAVLEFPDSEAGERTVGFSRGFDPEQFNTAKTEPVFLKDDFMRSPDQLGDWEPVSGSWKIRTQKNPSMSANAFSLSGEGEGIITAGRSWWHDYTFRASLSSGSESEAGIITEYLSPESYTVCRLTAGAAKLCRMENGTERVLSEHPVNIIPGQWYRIEGHVSRNFFSLSIDGHKVLYSDMPRLRAGGFGFRSEGSGQVSFDDVEISGLKHVKVKPLTETVLPFDEIGGKWHAENGRFVCSCSGPAEAVWGEHLWSEYSLEAVLHPGNGGNAGIGIYRSGEQDSCRIVYDGETDTCSLIIRLNGEEQIAGTFPAVREKDTVKLEISVRDSVLQAGIGGTSVYSRFFTDLSSGTPFLYADCTLGVSFDEVTLRFYSRTEAVATGNEIFTAEYSMASWAGSRSDWLGVPGKADGKSIRLNWHKAPMPGDLLLETECGKSPDGLTALMVGRIENGPEAGYRFVLDRPGGQGILFREKDQIAADSLPEGEIVTAGLRRTGNTFIGFINGTPLLKADDPEPLSADTAGWYDTAGKLSPEDVWVFSDSLFDYTFTRSPAEWRTGAGTWEVTNRWQCDPRWRFFSGYADESGAVLWNKRLFEGDITVECYVGVKMNNAKGRKYSYAANLNMVLCADGRDASSGYNFMFGGFKNTVSCITRTSEPVAKNSEITIPIEMNIHRRWFYLKAEKRGNRLVFSIDGKEVCTYTDPEPLTGNRIGFWTYDNGMMLARVRISSESGDSFESPSEEYPAECRTVYDE